MKDIAPNNTELHNLFLASPRKHILMITNHGVHEWGVVPGLPDTGGQNVFVNQFTASLTRFGYKITIVNRGGYLHPVSGEWQRGVHYKDENQRILYIQDERNEFVRKEDMHEQIPALVESLQGYLDGEGIPVNLIISHYWDAAKIGVVFNDALPAPVQHVWVPHSLGILKKRNVNPDRWEILRIDERINTERNLIGKLDGIAATSSVIRKTLIQDYGYEGPDLFLPPCVDTERYHPRRVDEKDPIWEFLSQHSGLPPDEVRSCKIITEISRTDATKRKDVLIKAFTNIDKDLPKRLLVVSIDDNKEALAQKLRGLIGFTGKNAAVAVVGSIWDILPTLYTVTDIYCTPSVMEGFGMSAQEAAATAVPVVASNLVPYVEEYLLGHDIEEVCNACGSSVKVGNGAIVVQADDIRGFTFALEILLKDDGLRQKMGEEAYHSTIPYFTWGNRVSRFLKMIGTLPE